MFELTFETQLLVLAAVATLWVVYIALVNLFGVEDTENWGYTSWYIDQDTKLKRRWHWITFCFTYWGVVGSIVTTAASWLAPVNHYPLSWLAVVILTIGVVVSWCLNRYRQYRIFKFEKWWNGPACRLVSGAHTIAKIVEQIRATTGKKVDAKAIGEWREAMESVIEFLVTDPNERHRIIGAAVEWARKGHLDTTEDAGQQG